MELFYRAKTEAGLDRAEIRAALGESLAGRRGAEARGKTLAGNAPAGKPCRNAVRLWQPAHMGEHTKSGLLPCGCFFGWTADRAGERKRYGMDDY